MRRITGPVRRWWSLSSCGGSSCWLGRLMTFSGKAVDRLQDEVTVEVSVSVSVAIIVDVRIQVSHWKSRRSGAPVCSSINGGIGGGVTADETPKASVTTHYLTS